MDRDAVLKIALTSYWTGGPTRVAISHICKVADVSKPSLYHEFGSDDVLKAAVLDLYSELVLGPFHNILTSNEGFAQQIEALIAFTTQDRQSLGIPSGCLQVALRAHREGLEEITGNKVDMFRSLTLRNYEAWMDEQNHVQSSRPTSQPTRQPFFAMRKTVMLCGCKEKAFRMKSSNKL